ncbi:hypothetical protein HMN09_00816100 [Mycena chlorophos]|uniref:Uncharacterized protein n=1 Tax=Mycena chlorophos TaxID=658473 RepID=A0A8H6W7B9_MYCCL|nr:hypothetical protein HMN09_00816100 [Mycena chlorophos]
MAKDSLFGTDCSSHATTPPRLTRNAATNPYTRIYSTQNFDTAEPVVAASATADDVGASRSLLPIVQAPKSKTTPPSTRVATSTVQSVPTLPAVINQLQGIHTQNITLIADLRSQLHISNNRVRIERERALKISAEYEDLSRSMAMRTRVLDWLCDSLTTKLEAEKERAEVLEGELKEAREQCKETEMRFNEERLAREAAETRLKALEESIEARETTMRQREDRLEKENKEQKSEDALSAGLAGTHA